MEKNIFLLILFLCKGKRQKLNQPVFDMLRYFVNIKMINNRDNNHRFLFQFRRQGRLLSGVVTICLQSSYEYSVQMVIDSP